MEGHATVRHKRIAARAVAALVAVGSLAYGVAAGAAELVMFEQAGCVWCKRWNEEIGPAYPKTEEGRIAPLRRVDIHKPIPEDLSDVTVERFTPVFVMMQDGEEVGRIRGYPGDEFFWFRLGELVDQLGPEPADEQESDS